MTAIPQKLTHFRVYADNDSETLIGVADVTLPTIEFMTDTLKGAGIGGEIDVPIIGHFSSMTLTLNWISTTNKMFLLARPETHALTLRGSIQVHDLDPAKRKPIHKPIKINVSCVPKKIEPGKFEIAAGQDASTELEVFYLKIWYDDAPQIEIDKYNLKYKVGDVDYLDQVRENLRA